MSEWWTYSLSDFLMFSPATYYRLIELYNLAVWPAQIVAAAAGLGIVLLLHRRGPGSFRIVAVFLAVAWTWIATAFLLGRYDAINWAGRYFAAGFLVQALLLAAFALAATRLRFQPPAEAARRLGTVVFLFALLAYPLIAVAAGRSWAEAEVFGLAPDPTAIGTLGLIVALAPGTKTGLILSILPVAWCGISGALLWAMQAPEAPVPPAAALVSLAAAAWRRPAITHP